MVMQKVWQWIRDRKTNSIRKWRSTFGVSTGASTSGEADGGQYFESLLDVPGGHLHPLHPIGGSDNALSMLRSEKIKRQQGSFLGRISRRLSPRNKSKKENYPEETNALLSISVNGTLEHDTGDFLDSKKLFDSVHQCLSEIPTSSTPLDVSPKSEKSLLSGSLEDSLDADCKKMADELFKHSVSTSRLAKKRDSETKRERKRTRFIIPQVSVTSYDPTSSTSVPVVVYPLSEPNELTSSYFEEEQFAEGEEYDLFEMDIPEVPKSEQENEEEIIEFQDEAETEAISSSRSNKNETIPENEPKITETPRRSVTDIDRRRMSLQQRRLSNVQLVQSVSGRRHSTTLIPLTCAQIHLVRALWRQVYLTKGPTVIGQTIIHKLFFKCTKTKEQFKRCPLPRSFPNHDSFSKAHCKAVAELIDQVVENLDNLENMSPDLEKLGRVHAQIMGGMLSSKLWNNVAETFIDCTLEWGDRRCRSETVRKAWALIIAFMVERIKVGHVEQRKQLLTLRSNAVSLDRSTASNHMRVTFV